MYTPSRAGEGDVHAAQEEAADGAIFADINITPLVDVVLVLLIIFMVTSSALVDRAQEARLEVALPEAGHAATPSQESDILVVGMVEDGRLFVQDRAIDEAQLEQLLAKTHAQAPSTAVVIDADGRLSHKAVVRILDKVRAAGFTSVGIGAEAR